MSDQKIPRGDRIPIDLFINTATTELERIASGEKISAFNIFTFALSLMQIVEKYPELSGLEKKKVVIEAFTMFLKRHGEENADLLLTLLPGFIEDRKSVV